MGHAVSGTCLMDSCFAGKDGVPRPDDGSRQTRPVRRKGDPYTGSPLPFRLQD